MAASGDAGLTMRKLAERAGMRLSNVQYYFKSRDDVLKAMVAVYFEQCTNELIKSAKNLDQSSKHQRLSVLIGTALKHGEQLTDMCRIFRELWAISSRNEVISQCLIRYYKNMADMVIGFALKDEHDKESREQLKCLLIPYIEGYSITALSLPLPADEVACMLTELSISLLESEQRR